MASEATNEVLGCVGVDPAVIPLVNYFNSIGLKTYMSCEGHNDTNQSMFWIEFDKTVTEEDIEAFLVGLKEKYGSSATDGCFAMRIFPGPKYTIRRWRYMAATKEAAEHDYLFFTTGNDVDLERASEASSNEIACGTIVYWARRYGRVVCKCQVIAINETDNRVISFTVKMLDDNYALDVEVHLRGSTLGDVVFVDEEMAKKRLEEFSKEDFGKEDANE